jgi:hypothetical protein
MPPASDKEVELIKATFKGNEPLLQAVRALFFGLPLSDTEKQLIKSTFASTELTEMMRRKLCPALDRRSPIGQVQDVWLGVEQMVFGQNRDTIVQSVQYKDRAVKMIEYAIGLLADPDGKAPDLTFADVVEDPLQIGLLARNQYIRHIEQQLVFIKVIAEQDIHSKPGKGGNDSAQ